MSTLVVCVDIMLFHFNLLLVIMIRCLHLLLKCCNIVKIEARTYHWHLVVQNLNIEHCSRTVPVLPYSNQKICSRFPLFQLTSTNIIDSCIVKVYYDVLFQQPLQLLVFCVKIFLDFRQFWSPSLCCLFLVLKIHGRLLFVHISMTSHTLK